MVTNRTLVPTKAPNLPIAPVEYDQRYIDQFANVFRLYFATIDNFTAQTGIIDNSQNVLIWMEC